MSNNKYTIYDLDSVIKKVQIIHKYENGGSNRRITKKEIILLLKKHLMQIKPVFLFLFVAFNYFFPGILMLLFSMFLLFGSVLFNAYSEYIDIFEKRELKEKKIREPEEFYYEEYRYATDLYNHVSEDERKYNEALDKQNKNKQKKEEELIYSKDDEINLLVEAIEDYFYCYKLPPLRIKDYEWDAFFDTLYKEFKDRGIEDEYFHAISEVIRYTLANTLVNGTDEIKMTDFLYNLWYLCKSKRELGILPNYFDYQDVESIQVKINLKIRNKRRKELKKSGKKDKAMLQLRVPR